MARRINGTQHTAFLDDMSLAQRVVSVIFDESTSRRFPEPVAANRRRMLGVIRGFLISGEGLSEEVFKSLLDAANTEECHSLKRSWESGAFAVRFVPAQEMERRVAPKVRDPSQALGYIRMRNAERPEILMKDLPAGFRDGVPLQVTHFRLLLSLFFTLIHEWEHWRQFSSGQPHSSEVAELLSHLEEHRLRVHIGDWEISRLASERRETVAQFLSGKIGESRPTAFQRLVRLLGLR